MAPEQSAISALFQVAVDLAASLSSEERFERLLSAAKKVIPCDAAAILKLQNGNLEPLVVDGLSQEVLGRRFQVSVHPRFQSILENSGVTRFESDSPLADPYDGLVDSCVGDLPVHACMGASLKVNERLWGVITFDALEPSAFDTISDSIVNAFSALAAAAASTAWYIEVLEKAVNKEQLVSENLIQQVLAQSQDDMIGESDAMARLRDEIDLVSGSDLNVLITGETGVGKELVARAVHKNSSRKRQPIVYLNCASLPENLAESELFGHRKGAFTGAVKDYRGKFELADGGTLFLDEVGELPLVLQAKLLRVLQSGEVQSVGAEKIQFVDVRVIAATNRNLKDEVLAGRFRQDLFHRLGVFPINVPPLRERTGDVALLVGYFIEKLSRRFGVASVTVSKDVMGALAQYTWPGNVRELEHLISRALLRMSAKFSLSTKFGLSENSPARVNVLTAEYFDLPQTMNLQVKKDEQGSMATSNETAKLNDLVDDFQRQVIVERLGQLNNNWAKTARHLGVDRGNFHRLAKRLGLK